MTTGSLYLDSIKSGAIRGWIEERIPASLTGAQAALESGWGTSSLARSPYNNQFGIKASADWTGRVVNIPTKEYLNGSWVAVNADFRAYDDINDSVADHAKFFTSTEWRKSNYKAVIGETDYKKACYAVKAAGYATDPDYASKLINIIEKYKLYEWDKEAQSGTIPPASDDVEVVSNLQPKSKVVGGDLSDAGRAFGKKTGVSVIGDSLGVGTEPHLVKLIPNSNYDVKGSRQITHSDSTLNGTVALQNMKNAGNLKQNVVVILGTNRGLTASEIDNFMNICGPERKVLWVETASAVKHNLSANAEMRKAATRHKNAFVLGWYDMVGGLRKEYYAEDDIHMTYMGYFNHAKAIVQGVYEMSTGDFDSSVAQTTTMQFEGIKGFKLSEDGKLEYTDENKVKQVIQTEFRGLSTDGKTNYIYNVSANNAYNPQTGATEADWLEGRFESSDLKGLDLFMAACRDMMNRGEPEATYRVVLSELPKGIEIGAEGTIVDTASNPPRYITARVSEITTSQTNPEYNEVVITNVVEVKPFEKPTTLLIQEELRKNRDKLNTDYKERILESDLNSMGGLVLATEDSETTLIADVEVDGEDVTEHYSDFRWERQSNNAESDKQYNEILSKTENGMTLNVSDKDIEGEESNFICRIYDDAGNLVRTIMKKMVSQVKIKKEIDTVLDRFDTERTETEQAINEALESAKAEAERLDNERQTLIDGQIAEVISQADIDRGKTNQAISNALSDAIAEAKRLDSLLKTSVDGQISDVISQAEADKTETSNAITKAKADAIAEAERLDNERQLIIDGKIGEAKEIATNISGDLEREKLKTQAMLEGLGVKPLSETHEAIVNDINNVLQKPISLLTDGQTKALQKANEALSSSQNVMELVSNLDVAGNNLFSLNEAKQLPVSTDWVVNAKVYQLTGLEPNTYYTLSSNAPIPEDISQTPIYFNGSGTDQSGVWLGNPKTKMTDHQGKITIYFPYDNDFRKQRTDEILNGKYEVMLNKGEIVQLWRPNIYDNQIKINSLYNQVSLNSEGITKLDGGVKKNTTDISILNGEIKKRLTQTEVNDVINNKGFATVTYTDNKTKETSEAFNQELSKVVMSIPTGYTNNNLFAQSKVVPLAEGSGVIVSNPQYRGYVLPVKAGERYLITRYGTTNNRWRAYLTVSEPKQGVPHKYKWSYDTQSAGVANEVRIDNGYNYLFLYLSNQADEIPKIKIELVSENGTSTPWTPSIEDGYTVGDFDKFYNSEYNKTATEIKSRLSSVEQSTNALNTNFNQRVETALGTSTFITSIKSSIPNDVKINELILADKAIKDTRHDNQPPSWYRTNYPLQTVKEFKTTGAIGLPYIKDGQFAILETTVTWRNTTGGTIKQTATNNMNDVYTRRGLTDDSDWTEWEREVSRADYHKVEETASLFSRTLGSTEGDIATNISRTIQTSGLIQNEVGKLGYVKENLFKQDYSHHSNSGYNTNWTSAIIKGLKPNEKYTLTYVVENGNRFGLYSNNSAKDIETWTTVGASILVDYYPTIKGQVINHTFTMPNGHNVLVIYLANNSGSVKEVNLKVETGDDSTEILASAEGLMTRTSQTREAISLALYDDKEAITEFGLVKSGVRIKGSNILLDGQVNMTSSFIVLEGNIGNLSAKKITSGTIDTARLNSSDIVTKGLTTNVVKSNHILADSALFDKLFVGTSMTDRLIAKGAWITNANISSLDASKITSGTIATARLDSKSIVTNGLQANVVKSTHIYADEALFTKLFTNDLATTKLATKTAWITNAMVSTLDASKITSGTIATARLDAKSIVTNGLQANVIKSTHIYADSALFTKLFATSLATNALATQTAWIKTGMIANAQIGTAQIGQIDAGTGKIVNIDAQYITANHAKLVSAGFQGLNSNMHIDGGAIRIQNNDGDFATMNAIPEFRSQDSAGTSAILGKGRSQYYSGNQSRFYIGSSLNGDEFNGSVVHGVHISKGQTWGIYRQSDAFGGTPAQYFKTPTGWGAVQVIEELMRTGKIVNNFTQASALIRGLNGWGNSFPVLQPGDMVMYQAAVPGNSSGIERIWTMGTSSNGSTRTYSHVHHVFEGGTTGVSDARLKHDIKPTDIKALDHIADLSFKQFKWNRNDELEPLGLIAQESGILRVPDEEMEGIDLQRAMMLALKGIQELSQKVQEMGA